MGVEDLYVSGGEEVAPSGGDNAVQSDSVPPDISPTEASADLAMIQQQLEVAQQQVNQYKTLSDQLLQFSVPKPEDKAADPEALLDEFEKDPSAVIRREAEKLVEERLKDAGGDDEVKQKLNALLVEKAKEDLSQKVEGYEEVFKDPGFKSFLDARPAFKTVLAIANEEFDTDSIAEVISLYKAAAEGGNGNGAASPRMTSKNPTNSPSRKGNVGGGKVLSREAIKRLSVENPTEFAKMSGEIALAYKEGRVK